MRRTKIIATIGPATENISDIEKLCDAGMNIARLNFSHGTYEQFKKIVKNIRIVAKRNNKIITIMQDLQGPKIRIGELENGLKKVTRDEKIIFSSKKEKGCIHIPYHILPKILKKDDLLLIEDGIIRTKILYTTKNKIFAQVLVGGEIKDYKGVNIPDSLLPASMALSLKDRKDLKFGIELGIDAVAMSFVEKAEDIRRLRKEMKKHTSKKIPIIAKIERPKALKNIEEIVNEADGIMVARGDLGIETPAERVPIEQKKLVLLARKKGKPSIIATQILQSMVFNSIATRAEISDAATAIFEHADAFMLSNETAVGAYPIKAVSTLSKVAKNTEEAIFQSEELSPMMNIKDPSPDETIALQACFTAEKINAKAIVVLTKGGHTASAVLKNRPKTPVIVITNTDTAKYLNFFWGTGKMYIKNSRLKTRQIKDFLQKEGQLKKGDDIVVLKLADNTSSLAILKI